MRHSPRYDFQGHLRSGSRSEDDLSPLSGLFFSDAVYDSINKNCMILVLLSEEASKKHPFPCPTTYYTALLHYLDITSCPRTNVLKDLAEYASNSDEKEFLLKLSKSTTEGKVCLVSVLLFCAQLCFGILNRQQHWLHVTFSALTLMVGQQEGIQPGKN